MQKPGLLKLCLNWPFSTESFYMCSINLQVKYKMNHRMRKPIICKGKNKDADQRAFFSYTDSTIPVVSKSKIQNFQPLAIFCDCAGRFVSDVVGTQIVGFLMHRLKYFPNLNSTKKNIYINKKYNSIHSIACQIGYCVGNNLIFIQDVTGLSIYLRRRVKEKSNSV